MPVRKLLLLGNPALYQVSEPVGKHELAKIRGIVTDLHETLVEFRRNTGAGRAIAAPQIGIGKRLFYMSMDNSSTVFLNPVLEEQSEQMIEVWDDCMCFPDLLVKVNRHKSCCVRYLDEEWRPQEMKVAGALAELIQHEYDHLEGILAVSRSVDERSFALRSQKQFCITASP